MRPSDTAPSHTSARRGFNLIEAAIVLGVVGVVIGGIWTAAASIVETRRQNIAFSGVMEAVYWINESFRATGGTLPVGTNMILTSTFLASKSIEGLTPNGIFAQGPWKDANLFLQIWVPFANTRLGYVRYLNIPPSSCKRMTRQFVGKNLGLYMIINIGSLPAADFEDGLSNAEISILETACDGGQLNLIMYL